MMRREDKPTLNPKEKVVMRKETSHNTKVIFSVADAINMPSDTAVLAEVLHF